MIWRILAAVAALTIAWPALAGELRCGAAEEVLKGLKDKYAEIPTMAGVTAGGQPTVVTVSPGGSWTALVVVGDKLCVAAAGKAIGKDA